MAERVPFTILTGFLGAGKTSVLNRMLATAGGRRIAVLVNELGRIAIDSRLILARGGDVLELAGGCVCCKVDTKNDLWNSIVDVIERSSPDHVVLETTGIAEPDAIFEGLDRLPEPLRKRFAPAGVVCVVDAEAGRSQIARREEARIQVECADRILLSKLDVAAPNDVDLIHDCLREINSEAERASFPRTEAGSRAMIPWVLKRHSVTTPRRGAEHQHRDGQLVAISFVDEAPLLERPLLAVIEELGGRLLRAKGFVHVSGRPQRAFLEVAGVRTTLTFGDPWADACPRTELVLIGEGLDESAIQRRLWACRAGGRTKR